MGIPHRESYVRYTPDMQTLKETCPHTRVYHSLDHDNFYCCECKQGMGQAFYDAMVAVKAVSAGIWKENGASGLAGAHVTVVLVEKALAHLDTRQHE